MKAEMIHNQKAPNFFEREKSYLKEMKCIRFEERESFFKNWERAKLI
jgi:hypothetical protein